MITRRGTFLNFDHPNIARVEGHHCLRHIFFETMVSKDVFHLTQLMIFSKSPNSTFFLFFPDLARGCMHQGNSFLTVWYHFPHGHFPESHLPIWPSGLRVIITGGFACLDNPGATPGESHKTNKTIFCFLSTCHLKVSSGTGSPWWMEGLCWGVYL